MATATERLRRLDQIVRADAANRGLAVWTTPWLLILPIVAMIGLAVAAPHPRLYHFLVDEDHVIEWTQFFAILAAGCVFAIASVRARRAGRRGLAVVFLLAAVGSLVVAGEEISWGQRLLGLGTPDVLEAINHQGETNIHNISIVQQFFNGAELLAGLYGVLAPIAWAIPAVRRWLAGWVDPLLIPPLALAVLFLPAFAYRAFRGLFLPDAGERITEFGELPELTLYLGILITGVLIARSLARLDPPSSRHQ